MTSRQSQPFRRRQSPRTFGRSKDHAIKTTSSASEEHAQLCHACRTSEGIEATVCRNTFHEICELEFSNAAYRRMHFHSVDAYVLQHPEARGNSFNAFHLLRLYWLLHVAGPDQARHAGRPEGFSPRNFRDLPFLEPPPDNGSVTVVDIGAASTAEEHGQRVLMWANSVWNAWSAHHDWAAACFESGPGNPSSGH